MWIAGLIRGPPPEPITCEVSHAGRRVVLAELVAGLSAYDAGHAGQLRG